MGIIWKFYVTIGFSGATATDLALWTKQLWHSSLHLCTACSIVGQNTSLFRPFNTLCAEMHSKRTSMGFFKYSISHTPRGQNENKFSIRLIHLKIAIINFRIWYPSLLLLPFRERMETTSFPERFHYFSKVFILFQFFHPSTTNWLTHHQSPIGS